MLLFTVNIHLKMRIFDCPHLFILMENLLALRVTSKRRYNRYCRVLNQYETKILVRLLEFITSLVQVHQGTTGTGTGTIIVLVPTW